MYEPCYTQTQGLVAFRCRVGACTKVVRTYRGIMMHCKRKHGLVAQMKLFDDIKEKRDGEAAAAEKPEPVREPRRESDRADEEDIFVSKLTDRR